MSRFLSLISPLRFWLFACLSLQAGIALGADAEKAPGQTIRLGIVVEGDLASAADVLTPVFSAQKGVELLERTEAARLYREQSLSTAAGGEIQTGQVIGAHGLLILSPAPDNSAAGIRMRLVNVRSGVVLYSARSTWPVADSAEWSTWVWRQFSGCMPKLAVLPKDAVPISIVGMRSSMQSSEALETELQLTLLATEQLSRLPNVFVLERRNMSGLSSESELKESSESDFWRGGYLLEGAIDQGGFSKDELTLDVRLRPASGQGQPPANFRVTGPRTNLTAVVRRMVERLQEVIRSSPPDKAWDASAEAAQYFSEAKWALQWQAYAQAQAAAEAAWAMGLQNQELSELRIRAWHGAGGLNGYCVIDEINQLVVFRANINSRVILRGAGSLRNPPDFGRLASCLRALSLLEACLYHVKTGEYAASRELVSLSNACLEQASWWLRYLYFNMDVRSRCESELVELRRLARSCSELARNTPAFQHADSADSAWVTAAKHAAFWYDTPEQTLELYKDIRRNDRWPLVRNRFFNAFDMQSEFRPMRPGSVVFSQPGHEAGPHADLASPPLAGWTWQERVRANELWRQFVRESSEATEARSNVEGRLLSCSWAWSEEQFASQFKSLVDYLKTNRTQLESGAFLQNLTRDMRAMVDVRKDSLAQDRRESVEGSLASLESDVRRGGSRDFASRSVAGASVGAAGWPAAHTNGVHYAMGNRERSNAPPSGVGSGVLQTAASFDSPKHLLVTNVLVVNRFWKVPDPPQDNGANTWLRFVKGCYRDGKFWALGAHSENSSGTHIRFFEINLRSLKSEMIPIVVDRSQGDSWFPVVDKPDRTFEIFNGSLFFAVDDKIRRFSLSERKWSVVELPSPGPARPVRVGDRLFFTTATSILEQQSDGGFKLIGSSRRVPQVNTLDAVQQYGLPDLFRGGDGTLFACFWTDVYSQKPGSNDWQIVGKLHPFSESVRLVFDGGMLALKQAPYTPSELYGIVGRQSSVQLLMVNPRSQTPRFASRNVRLASPPIQGDSFQVLGQTPCAREDEVWFLADLMQFAQSPDKGFQMVESSGRHNVLLRYKVGERSPAAIPLRFEFRDTELTRHANVPDLVRAEVGENYLLWTPEGLVISRRYVP